MIIKIDVSNVFNTTDRALTSDKISGRASRDYACDIKEGDVIGTVDSKESLLWADRFFYSPLFFFLFLRPCTRTFLFFWVRTFTGSRYEVYEVAVTCTSCFMSSVGCLVCWRNTSLMTALGVDQCIVVLSSTSWGSVFHKVSYSWWGASDVFFREHDVIKSWPLLLSTRKGKSVTNTSRIFNFMCVCCSIIDEV